MMDLDILGLSVEDSRDLEKIKTAYREALLTYHPDKSLRTSSRNQKRPGVTVQHIKNAYNSLIQKLGDPEKSYISDAKSIVASDIIDLDDMRYDEASNGWWSPCRCGEVYILTEDELISNGNNTEVNIQCVGCSLWLNVQYAVVGDDI